jgi:thiamine pyrophosphate-dependent acetolactate synthase large subunit-like protein
MAYRQWAMALLRQLPLPSNDNAPVLSVIGDGGLMMYLGELETVTYRHHVLYVVLCDNSLALIESARRRKFPLHGMRFNMPDITQIGDLFGIPVTRQRLVRSEKCCGPLSKLSGLKP